MGAGDWLMAAGEARAVHERTGQKVVIVDRNGRPQWIDLWRGVPYILPCAEQGCAKVVSGSGVRPYIISKTSMRWKWKPYTPKPAEIRFNLDEQSLAREYGGSVMIEPNVKDIGHRNKAWPWSRWEQLVEAMPGVEFVQCLQGGTRPLSHANVRHVLTLTFRDALAVLSGSRALVTTEGGLMHGAAAVGVRAVVLWSEYIAPANTGYSMHVNLRHAGAGCGKRINCPSCRASMDAITVGEVREALVGILERATA